MARSLDVLRDQVNTAYPGRNRASDGTISDLAHQAQVSDHNPDRYGIVRALDLTHDPSRGFDIDQFTDALVASRDQRISYLIANRQITGPNYGWVWYGYDGDDPHTGHVHVSVVADARADQTGPWSIGSGATVAPVPSRKANGMIIATNGASYVLTDWKSWTDSSLSWTEIQTFQSAGVATVAVSEARLGRLLTLPVPGPGSE